VVKRQSEFDGSWTIFDSGLMDDLSREVYDAFARDVSDDERRGKRMRKVGRWVVELVVEALFVGLAGQLA
jgi:distribution and morphology protein 31